MLLRGGLTALRTPSNVSSKVKYSPRRLAHVRGFSFASKHPTASRRRGKPAPPPPGSPWAGRPCGPRCHSLFTAFLVVGLPKRSVWPCLAMNSRIRRRISRLGVVSAALQAAAKASRRDSGIRQEKVTSVSIALLLTW